MHAAAHAPRAREAQRVRVNQTRRTVTSALNILSNRTAVTIIRGRGESHLDNSRSSTPLRELHELCPR